MTEGRFTFETKARDKPPAMSREAAAARYQLPTFVGHAYQPGDAPGSTSVTLLSVEYPEYVLDAILGATTKSPGRSPTLGGDGNSAVLTSRRTPRFPVRAETTRLALYRFHTCRREKRATASATQRCPPSRLAA